MAPKRICSIPECGKPHGSHGYCDVHARKFKKHGDPLHSDLKTHARDFIQAVRMGSKDCIIWPYAVTLFGYGKLSLRPNKNDNAHRWVCRKFHGEPPFEGAEAAHSCGVRLCVNPEHLSWKTPKQNSADRLIHGTDSRGEKSPLHKVTTNEVLEIRRLAKAKVRFQDIATIYGLSASGVNTIVQRRTWKHLPIE